MTGAAEPPADQVSPPSAEYAGLLVDTLNASFGGAHRPAHAVGIGLQGVFVPALDASSFCSAKVFTGQPTAVTARFSNGAGGRNTDDRKPDVRGISVKFHVGPDVELDMIAVSMPFFFVKTPEEFVEFLRLSVPRPETGRPDPVAFAAWFATHPHALAAYEMVGQLGADQSFAGLQYNSLHAFRYTDAKGLTTVARFSWIPDQPAARFPHGTDTSSWPTDYLRRELVARVRAGNTPAFTLVAQVQGPGDPDDDSSVAWKSTDFRTLGRLQLGSLVPDQYWGCEALKFNPGRMIDGIEMSPDPVLQARHVAYATSAVRRTAAYPSPTFP